MMILLRCFVFLKIGDEIFYNKAAVVSRKKPYFKGEIQLLKIIEYIFQTCLGHARRIRR